MRFILTGLLFLMTAGHVFSAEPTTSSISPDTGDSAADNNTSATTLTLAGTNDNGASVDILVGTSSPPTTVAGNANVSGTTWNFNLISGVTTPGFYYFRPRSTLGGVTTLGTIQTVYIDPTNDAPSITAVSPGTGGVTNDSTPKRQIKS